MEATEELIQRLNKVRTTADQYDRERSRLTGENDSQKKRLAELGETCKKEFNCAIEELPDLIEKAQAEATAVVEEAETVLGMREPPQPVAGASMPTEDLRRQAEEENYDEHISCGGGEDEDALI